MSKNNKLILISTSCIGFLLASVFISGAATSGSHYPFGGEGVLAATAPPPGFHYRMYNTYYRATTLKGNNSDTLDVGFDLKVFSSVQRFVHVTKKKILGANYIYNVLVPLVYKDVNIDAFGISDRQSLSVGDVVLEPFALAWHKSHWDAVAALAVIAPTGHFDSQDAASVGLGYWSGMLTLGGTFYFDDEKTWSVSALTRTLVNTEQQDTNVTPGAEFIVEYGVGKEIAIGKNFLIRPGIAGCAYWQLADDSGDGPATIADERKEAYALGAEVNLFWLPKLLQMNLRVLRDFGAENTAEGSQVVLTLTKSF